MNRLLTALLGLLLLTTIAFAQQAPNRQNRKNARNRFEQMDTDHDGRISRSEWKGRARRFNRLDLNHDGYISREEFRQARKQRRRPATATP